MVNTLPNGRPVPGVGVRADTTKPTLMAPGPGGTTPARGSTGRSMATTSATVPVAYRKGGVVGKGSKKGGRK